MRHFYKERNDSEIRNVGTLPRISGGVLCPFGKELRKLRFSKNKRIFDLARDLEVSSSSVSAWETGRREVKNEDIQKIGHIFDLDQAAIERLRQAAELSKSRVVIEPHSDEAKELANLIRKKINELSTDTIEAIAKYLRWTPEGRVRWDIKVARRTTAEIEEIAQRVRIAANYAPTESFDIVKFCDLHLDMFFFNFMPDGDFNNTCFEVWDNEDMPENTRGMATMFPPHIVVSNSVYEDAAGGGHGGRWIMCHELGHLLLLHGIDSKEPTKLKRGPEYFLPASGDVVNHNMSTFSPPPNLKRIPKGQSAETQADDFAAELLMPRLICKNMLPHNISLRYGVSVSLAKKRLKIIRESFH